MNKIAKDTNLENILFFDIETVSRNKNLKIDTREYDLYSWDLRDKETDFLPPAKDVIKHYKKKAALKPEYNKIVAISVGFFDGTTLRYKSLEGTQKEMIEEFYKLVKSRSFILCGHNIIGFDVPTIRLKAFEEGIIDLLPESISDSGQKPWDLEKKLLDTMKILTGTYYYNISLDKACMMRNIESSKDDIKGSEVSEVYYNEGKEGLKRIKKYCDKDVVATAKLFLSLIGKENYATEFLNVGEFESMTVNVINHIRATGELTTKIENEIVEWVKTEKENPQNTFDIVKASVLSKNPKTKDEYFKELEDKLGLSVDYSLIQVVVDKGNLGKAETNRLILLYEDSEEELKKEVIRLTKQFLIDNNKIEQKRTSESFKLLKEKLWQNN